MSDLTLTLTDNDLTFTSIEPALNYKKRCDIKYDIFYNLTEILSTVKENLHYEIKDDSSGVYNVKDSGFRMTIDVNRRLIDFDYIQGSLSDFYINFKLYFNINNELEYFDVISSPTTHGYIYSGMAELLKVILNINKITEDLLYELIPEYIEISLLEMKHNSESDIIHPLLDSIFSSRFIKSFPGIKFENLPFDYLSPIINNSYFIHLIQLSVDSLDFFSLHDWILPEIVFMPKVEVNENIKFQLSLIKSNVIDRVIDKVYYYNGPLNMKMLYYIIERLLDLNDINGNGLSSLYKHKPHLLEDRKDLKDRLKVIFNQNLLNGEEGNDS